MALTLRDSHSYETQIIDAVRGVNRALGGTYGTSSAIHKSEFNQYEVQLIDAIKGIGRTLSGNGLSLAGGGASSKELQDLAKRVTKLESESFFRLVNGNVTLKEQYQNLWVPGWLSAGGIGSGGGGASYLKDLLDVYHDANGILRGDGTSVSNGDVLVYDSTNSRWVAGAVSSAGTVTNYGDSSTGRIATVGGVDIYNGVKWGAAGQTSNTFTLTINGTTKTVCLDGYGGGGGGSTVSVAQILSSGTKIATITVDNVATDLYAPSGGSGYIGQTQVQATAADQALIGILSINATTSGSSNSRIVWEPNAGGTGIGAWHFYGNVYSDGWISAGGIGSGGGGGGGIDLTDVWASLTKTVSDVYSSTKIHIDHIPNITASMVTDLGTWASSSLYTLRTPVATSAANGTLLGVDALSNASSSTPGSDSSRIEWDATNYAWRVRGNLYADGWVSAGGIGSGGGGATSLSGLTDVNDNLSPAAGNVFWYDNTNTRWDAHALVLNDISNVTTSSLSDGQALVWDATNSVWVNRSVGGGGNVYIGNGSHSPTITDVVSSSYENRQVLCYISAQEKWTNVRLSLNDVDLPSSIASSSGYLYHDPVSGWAIMPGGGGGGSTVSWGTEYSNDTINLIVNGTTRRVCLNGYSSGGGSYTLPAATASALGGIMVGSVISTPTINSPSTTSGRYYYVQCNSSGLAFVNVPWSSGSGGGSTVTVTQVLSSGTKIATITVDGSPTDLYAPSGGGSVTGYIGTTAVQGSSAAQDLTGILSINATSSSSSLSRMVWDSTNNAWHFLGNLYADGWVSAGGAGNNSSDVYVKYVNCSDQTAYNNISTKDKSTIYTIGTTTITKVYLGAVQLYPAV